MNPPLSRRRAIAGAATAGIGAPLVAACSGDDTRAVDPQTSREPAGPPSDPAATTTTTPTGQAPASGLVAVGDVPVGGGVVLSSEELVVVQPTDGTIAAFSAICTHQGCLVGSVSDGVITCPCHNSTFSIEDGAPLSGPADGPLAQVPVQVSDGQVVRS